MHPIKAIANIFKFTLYLALFTFGVFYVLDYYNVAWARDFIQSVETFFATVVFAKTSGSFFFGIALILIWLPGFLNIFTPETVSEPYVTIQDDSGYVHVSVEAIREFVKKIALQQNEVVEARARVIYRKRLLMISLKLGVTSRQSITGVAEVLKRELQQKIITTIGISEENIAPIELAVENIDKKTHSTDAIEPASEYTESREMMRVR